MQFPSASDQLVALAVRQGAPTMFFVQRIHGGAAAVFSGTDQATSSVAELAATAGADSCRSDKANECAGGAGAILALSLGRSNRG
jgi:hypothetical protein